MDNDTYSFENVRRRRQTQKAYLCEIGSGSFWVPKSQIISLDGPFLVTTLWWAEVSGAQDAYDNSTRSESTTSSDLYPAATVIFRRLAMKYHPDRNPDSVEFMKDLNELWQAVRQERG